MPSLKEHAKPLRPHLQPLRQQLLVDQQVQGVLLLRLAFYAGASAIYFAVIQLCTHAILEPELGLAGMLIRFTDETIYWAPGLLLLMPLVAYDMLRVTNRFTGPTLRLRKQMQGLAEGDAVEPLEFRRDDYWQELAASFNALREEVLRLRGVEEAKAQQGYAESADAEPTAAAAPGSVGVATAAPADASADEAPRPEPQQPAADDPSAPTPTEPPEAPEGSSGSENETEAAVESVDDSPEEPSHEPLARPPQANSPQQAVAPQSAKEPDPPADDAITQDMIDQMLATS